MHRALGSSLLCYSEGAHTHNMTDILTRKKTQADEPQEDSVCGGGPHVVTEAETLGSYFPEDTKDYQILRERQRTL